MDENTNAVLLWIPVLVLFEKISISTDVIHLKCLFQKIRAAACFNVSFCQMRPCKNRRLEKRKHRAAFFQNEVFIYPQVDLIKIGHIQIFRTSSTKKERAEVKIFI